jgi:hypothetical protein
MRQNGIVIALCAWIVAWMLAAGVLRAADAALAWRDAEGVSRQLEQPVSINWLGVPLRQAVQNLARSQRVALMLDRRVDPDQEIELTLNDVALGEALSRIAAKLNLGMSRSGPVMYLGPAATAERLRTLVELREQEIDRLPAALRARLRVPKSCRWAMLSTPRELLAAAGGDYGLRIEPSSNLPHDLWPAGELPPVGLAERISLITAQFDLTFELSPDGGAVGLIPMPQRPVLEKSYRAASPAEAIGSLKNIVKHAELIPGDRTILVRGPAEEHDLVAAMLSGKKVRRAVVKQGKTIYQLKIVMPVGRLIRELGPKLNLDIEIDEPAIERAGLSLDKDVNISVKDVSEEQLLKAVLEPAGLTFTRAGEKLVVRPK